MYDNHKQVQTDIMTHSKEKMLRMLKEVGLESRLERGESGSLTQGEREGVPDGWAIGRKRTGTKGRVFGVRDVQSENVRGGTKRADMDNHSRN